MRRCSSHCTALRVLALWAMSAGAADVATNASRSREATCVRGEPLGANRPVVLTVRAAVDRALARDEGIAAAQGALLDADQQKVSARQLRDPELRPSQSSECNQVGVRLYVPNPWARSHRVDAAAFAGNAVSAELERAAWLVETRVREVFVEIDFLDRDLAVVEELAELRRKALELTRQRVGGGEAATPELVPVSGRYLTALAEREQAERRRGTARRQLAAMVTLPGRQLQLVGDTERSTPADLTGLSLLALEQRAIRKRADLLATSWRATAALAVCEESRSERIPWFNHVQVTRTEDTGGGEEWSVEMAIGIPVFSWSSQTPDPAVARYHRLQAAAQEAPRRVAWEVRSAWHAAEDALAARRLHEERVTPVVAELSKVHQQLREADDVYRAEIIDVRIQLLALERTRLRLKREVMQTLILLEQAVGTPLYCEGDR